MRRLATCTLLLFLTVFFYNATGENILPKSPLDQFSTIWNDLKYEEANSAYHVIYMNEKEKQVIYILNLVRMNPSLFESTVLSQYPAFTGKADLKNNIYYKSLSASLKKMKPLPLLLPNKFCFESAQCHAQSSGIAGHIGHDRINSDCKKKSFYFGECISYGFENALDIVLALLIDDGVPNLGHRLNLLGAFNSVAVSIQPHTSYRFNAVIDLAY